MGVGYHREAKIAHDSRRKLHGGGHRHGKTCGRVENIRNEKRSATIQKKALNCRSGGQETGFHFTSPFVRPLRIRANALRDGHDVHPSHELSAIIKPTKSFWSLAIPTVDFHHRPAAADRCGNFGAEGLGLEKVMNGRQTAASRQKHGQHRAR